LFREGTNNWPNSQGTCVSRLAKAFYATTDRRAALATQYSFIESRLEQLFFGTLFAHTKV